VDAGAREENASEQKAAATVPSIRTDAPGLKSALTSVVGTIAASASHSIAPDGQIGKSVSSPLLKNIPVHF
jgi:hypothetical protein